MGKVDYDPEKDAQQKRLAALAQAKKEAEEAKAAAAAKNNDGNSSGSQNSLSVSKPALATTTGKRRGRKPKTDDQVATTQYTCKFPSYILDTAQACCPALYKDLTQFIVNAVTEKYEREKDLLIQVSDFQRKTNEQAAQLRAIMNQFQDKLVTKQEKDVKEASTEEKKEEDSKEDSKEEK